MMYAIKTENLRKEYRDVTAVNGLNLCVERGELFSLLGVNGAGKTTTIKMLSCLSAPSSGDAWLNGQSIVHQSAAVKAIIGVSPQETAVRIWSCCAACTAFPGRRPGRKRMSCPRSLRWRPWRRSGRASSPAAGSVGSALPWR